MVSAATLLHGSSLLLAGWLLLSGISTAGVVLAGVAIARLAAARERIGIASAIAATLAMTLCFFLGSALESQGQIAEADRQLAQLAAALDDVARETGRYPDSLRELGWRLPPIVGDSRPVDPWGRPWRYRTLAEGGGFAIASPGPDGVPESDDDIELVSPANS